MDSPWGALDTTFGDAPVAPPDPLAPRTDEPASHSPLPNPQLLDDTRREIRRLVGEIAQWAQADVSLETFAAEFTTRVAQAMAAEGAALWLVEQGAPRLAFQINLAAVGLAADPAEQPPHAALLAEAIAAGQPALSAPQSGAVNGAAGNPSPWLLVLGPVVLEGRTAAVLEIVQRPNVGPTTQRGYVRFVAQMCGHLAEFLTRRRLRQLGDRQREHDRRAVFLRQVHGSLDRDATALAIANEGRLTLGCDRAVVLARRGRQCRTLAVSGLAAFDRHSPEIGALERLAAAVVATGEPLWWGDGATTDDDLPPQIVDALHAHLEGSPARRLAVVPLYETPPPSGPVRDDVSASRRPCGALVLEQFRGDAPLAADGEQVATIVEHAGLALGHALTAGVWPLAALGRWWAERPGAQRLREHPRAAAAAVCATLLAGAAWLPVTDYAAAPGVLRPVVERQVFAHLDAVVVEAPVTHGEMVAAGEPVVLLRSAELDIQLAELLGRRASTAEQRVALQRRLLDERRLAPAEEHRLGGELAELTELLAALDAELALLRHKREATTVRAPIAGEVVAWQVRESLLARPVERGQRLLSIVDPDGPWRLELELPEHRLARLRQAQQAGDTELPVSFYLGTHPGVRLVGRVTEVRRQASDDEDSSAATITVLVDVDRSQLPELRIGATAAARIELGRRPWIRVWASELYEAAYRWLVFWI